MSVFPSHQLNVETTPSSRGQLSFKRWSTPSFRLPELHTKQKGTQMKRKNTLISENAQIYQTVTKIEGLRQANFFYIFLIPLLFCHIPSTVRERLVFVVTVAFPGTQSSHCAREPS